MISLPLITQIDLAGRPKRWHPSPYLAVLLVFKVTFNPEF